MTIPAEVRGKFYTLRAAAVVVGLSGGAAVVLAKSSFGLRSLGLLGILVGISLVRRSNAIARKAQTGIEWFPAKPGKRVGRLAWILTAASLAACVIFYLAMYVDALHGGREGWPAYAFAAAGLALAATSGYVAMKLFQ